VDQKIPREIKSLGGFLIALASLVDPSNDVCYKPMDSLVIEGKEYISAKRAAREHSYTMDYVGQLIRGGKLSGQKVGRSWYVEHDSLTAYVRSLAGKEMKGPSHASAQSNRTHIDAKEVMQDIYVQPAIHATQTYQVIEATHIPVEPELLHEQPIISAVPITPVVIPIQKKEEVRTRSAFDYTMLNYVQDTGDAMPELGVKQSSHMSVEDKSGIKINRIHNSVPDVSHVAPQLTTLSHIKVAPKFNSYESSIATNTAPEKHFVDVYEDHHPTVRTSLLPALVAAGLALAIFALAGGSLFFKRTMNYEAATSAVTTGFMYSDLGN